MKKIILNAVFTILALNTVAPSMIFCAEKAVIEENSNKANSPETPTRAQNIKDIAWILAPGLLLFIVGYIGIQEKRKQGLIGRQFLEQVLSFQEKTNNLVKSSIDRKISPTEFQEQAGQLKEEIQDFISKQESPGNYQYILLHDCINHLECFILLRNS